MSLEGRIAVVTGGASGISKAMASALGTSGAKVIIADIDDEAAAQVAGSLRSKGIQADFKCLDVTKRQSIEDVFKGIIEQKGAIDILFNGAGILNRQPVLDIAEEDWDRVLAVNLKGTFLCTQIAARYMVEQRYGRIINIASTISEGSANNSDYTASKTGVMAFTRSFGIELRALKVDVTVNAVALEATDTPLWRKGKSPEEIERRLSSGKIHLPKDIGPLVIFLASPESSPINGQIIVQN